MHVVIVQEKYAWYVLLKKKQMVWYVLGIGEVARAKHMKI